jgi:hypothetical protein
MKGIASGRDSSFTPWNMSHIMTSAPRSRVAAQAASALCEAASGGFKKRSV